MKLVNDNAHNARSPNQIFNRTGNLLLNVKIYRIYNETTKYNITLHLYNGISIIILIEQ